MASISCEEAYTYCVTSDETNFSSNYIEFFQPLPKKTPRAQKSSTPVVSTEEASDALNRIVVEAAASVDGSIYDRTTEFRGD